MTFLHFSLKKYLSLAFFYSANIPFWKPGFEGYGDWNNFHEVCADGLWWNLWRESWCNWLLHSSNWTIDPRSKLKDPPFIFSKCCNLSWCQSCFKWFQIGWFSMSKLFAGWSCFLCKVVFGKSLKLVRGLGSNIVGPSTVSCLKSLWSEDVAYEKWIGDVYVKEILLRNKG